jgi:hypothetical protein
MRIEGRIIVWFIVASAQLEYDRTGFVSPLQGFDEFMNLVVDEAAEIFVKDAKPRRELGAWL